MAVPRFETIEIDGLILRPVVADDVEALWRRRNDPSIAEFQNWALPYPLEKAQELIDEMVAYDATPPSNGWFQMSVDDLATGNTIGDLALGLSFDGRCAELGWTIDAAASGRGVATRSAAALSAWLFDTVGVTRVQAMMHPENLASVRVAERLGMVFEGHTRNSYWVGDENSDDWIFAMTPEDWRSWVGRARIAADVVKLVEITPSNLGKVEQLATHRSQERFVATMAASFADALVPGPATGTPAVPWFRAIEADGDVVGFVMTIEPSNERPVPTLLRLLIDRMHQRRGVGGAAVDLIIERAKSQGAPALEVSWVEGPGSPADFYRSRGFEPTGQVDDGETVGRLTL